MSASPFPEALLGFVLHPGWGFPAESLAPWAQALSRRWPRAGVQVCERGYFSEAKPPRPLPDRFWIGIGHSFGHAVLRQEGGPWTGLVALHGFTRFCRRPGRPEGTPARLVDAMRARLHSQPQAVLNDFYRLCGSGRRAPAAVAVQALDEDLHGLRELDLPPAVQPLLALSSRDDAVVPAALSEACFAGGPELVWREGDHCAWLRAADEGVAHLAQWLTRMAWPEGGTGGAR